MRLKEKLAPYLLSACQSTDLRTASTDVCNSDLSKPNSLPKRKGHHRALLNDHRSIELAAKDDLVSISATVEKLVKPAAPTQSLQAFNAATGGAEVGTLQK